MINYLILHLLFIVYALNTVLGRMAAPYGWTDWRRFALLAGVLFLLGIYAAGWQVMLKKFNLGVAYANRAAVVIWGILLAWLCLLFPGRWRRERLWSSGGLFWFPRRRRMSEEFYIGLNLFSVFLASCTQVVLKKSAMNDRLTGLAYFVNPATMAAYSVFLGCCLLTFYCLSHLPMITVNMLECSAYVYILLFDRIFFGKPITMRKVGGNAMIIAGIIVCLNR